MKGGYVYMLANRYRGTIYIGVTSDLVRRCWQHKEKVIEGFSKRYDLTRLVWYETHETIESAIVTEKKLKNCGREVKCSIIERTNPDWRDLYADIAGAEAGSCAPAFGRPQDDEVLV